MSKRLRFPASRSLGGSYSSVTPVSFSPPQTLLRVDAPPGGKALARKTLSTEPAPGSPPLRLMTASYITRYVLALFPYDPSSLNREMPRLVDARQRSLRPQRGSPRHHLRKRLKGLIPL
ncbi:hypothetical protein MPNT_50039 [Candidatus Methylacidithermus pantelleriae]|uniref:Uncharacterized protein n=1 Tax=Candidatus Methylacidithermus pantelleriae TaxID=2744239 RepID=A0A8J2FX05_9BACT|nr:hypothetical protein MPNT_50039 [Candidatus Methylacidithermus pantelleriae]